MAARSHRRRSWALTSVAVSLVLLAPACGGDDTATSPAPTAAAAITAAATEAPAVESSATSSADDTAPAATAAAATEAPAEAPAAAPIELLSFTAPLVGGGTFDGAGYAAERPVAFWFWAPT